MIIRVGIPASFKRFSGMCATLGAPVLISANSMRGERGFRVPKADLFSGCDCALDSAGFVAMVRYGGYPWSREEYIGLAKSFPWAWYASRDFCCEPQIAKDAEEVARRVQMTVDELLACRAEALKQGAPPPTPILQGYRPDDYARCIEGMTGIEGLVGVGSVCRREIGGEAGLLTILNSLDRHLPTTTRLHLFGVKGAAIRYLAGHPRIHSIDSMAWDSAARRRVAAPRTVEKRGAFLRAWYLKQTASLGLFGAAA